MSRLSSLSPPTPIPVPCRQRLVFKPLQLTTGFKAGKFINTGSLPFSFRMEMFSVNAWCPFKQIKWTRAEGRGGQDPVANHFSLIFTLEDPQPGHRILKLSWGCHLINSMDSLFSFHYGIKVLNQFSLSQRNPNI